MDSELHSLPGLKRFLDIEREYPEVSEEQHIFNKALFDAANEAIQTLLPPYNTRLTAGQARVKKEVWGSAPWKAVLHIEVEQLVESWSHSDKPDLDEDDAMRIMLIRDVHQVHIHPRICSTISHRSQIYQAS